MPDIAPRASLKRLHLIRSISLNKYLISYRKSVCLLLCLHFETNSVLLVRMLPSIDNARKLYKF